jgi:hypothetical protein
MAFRDGEEAEQLFQISLQAGHRPRGRTCRQRAAQRRKARSAWRGLRGP